MTRTPDAPPERPPSASALAEMELALRHLISIAEEAAEPQDPLLGVGAQMLFARTGVRYMSLKNEIDGRVQEIVAAIAIVNAAIPQCGPAVRLLLDQAQALLREAQRLSEPSPSPTSTH